MPRTLLVLIGAPGAGETTAAKQIMTMREAELQRPLVGDVLSVDHPDGQRNKKGDGIKQVTITLPLLPPQLPPPPLVVVADGGHWCGVVPNRLAVGSCWMARAAWRCSGATRRRTES